MLFDFLRKNKSVQNIAKAKEEESVWNERPNDVKNPVWKLKRTNDILVGMCNHLTSKTSYGENMEALTKEERVFYITTEVECEVNNGGFEHFFYGDSGKFANEAAEALKEIGAENMAFFCEKAMSIFEKALPENRKERAEFLKEVITDEKRAILDECTEAFEKDPDEFNKLVFQYMVENRHQFE